MNKTLHYRNKIYISATTFTIKTNHPPLQQHQSNQQILQTNKPLSINQNRKKKSKKKKQRKQEQTQIPEQEIVQDLY